MQRRTLLTSIATAAGGAGATALLLGSAEPAEASVSMGSLDMNGDSKAVDDGNIRGVKATVSGSWSYELPGGEPDHWLVQLQVSDGDAWYTVGEQQNAVSYKQYSGQYQVTGSVTSTEGFDASYFAAPGPGKQTTVELPMRVRFRVVDANDTALADSVIEDMATVVVGQPEINASLYGEVSGGGSVTIE